MISPLSFFDATLAFTAPTVFAQENQVGGPSCSPHPADALQCAYDNGTSVGSICATSSGVLCCTVPSDCKEPNGTSVYTQTSSLAPAPVNTGFPARSGNPTGSCYQNSNQFPASGSCIPNDGSSNYYPCDSVSGGGVYCCEFPLDCKAASAGSSSNGSASVPSQSSTPTTSARMSLFTNEAVAGHAGMGAAAVAGAFGVMAALL